MPAMLEVDGLVKKYGDFEAVKGISFSVEEGEVFGLLGPNGAGKTQTISMLTGVIQPTSGTARVGGHDLRTQMDEVKKINGLVPQDLAAEISHGFVMLSEAKHLCAGQSRAQPEPLTAGVETLPLRYTQGQGDRRWRTSAGVYYGTSTAKLNRWLTTCPPS